MKTPYVKIFISCLAIMLCLTACSDKEQEKGNAGTLPPSEYEESSLPDGFVFPGDSPVGNNGVNADDTVNPPSYTEKAMSVSAYISENTDLSRFEEYISETEDGCIIDYILKSDADISERALAKDITIGTEKLEIFFPTTAAQLLEKGFTWINEGDSEAEAASDSILTLCTPETKEIVGFVVGNADTVTASEAEISGVMLTSYNNFTYHTDITGTTDLGKILSLAGLPDMISVNAASEETSVVLGYIDAASGTSVTILADGDTKGLIAMYLIGSEN